MSERWDAPYLRGQAAACIALEPSDNPFPANSGDFIEWLRGYRAWERESAERGQGDSQLRPGFKAGAKVAKLANGA